MKWTKEQDQHLTELFKQKKNLGQMAIGLNRSEHSVARRITVLKLHHGKKRQRTMRLHTRHWTKKEIAILKDMYPLHGTKEIGMRLGRPQRSVGTKARELGLAQKKALDQKHRYDWQESDTEKLIQLIPCHTLQDISEQMDKAQSVIWRVFQGLVNEGKITEEMRFRPPLKRYSASEIEYLTNSWGDTSIEEMAVMLNRSATSIKKRLFILGFLVKEKRNPKWSAEEDEQITSLYFQGETDQYIAEHMGRTCAAVKMRIRTLELSNKMDTAFPQHLEAKFVNAIKELYPFNSVEKMAEETNKRLSYVSRSVTYFREMGMMASERAIPQGWSPQQYQILLNDISHLDALSLASKIGKSLQQVKNVATRRNLVLIAPMVLPPAVRSNKRWTKEEQNCLKQKTETSSIQELASELGRSTTAVYLRLNSKRLLGRDMDYPSWTQAQEEILTSLFLQGETNATIAKALNKTATAIANRIANLNLCEKVKESISNGLDQAYMDSIRDLYTYYPPFKIAGVLNKRRSFVTESIRYMHDKGLLKEPVKLPIPIGWSLEEFRILITEIGHCGVAEVAAKLGKTEQQIRNIVTRRNLMSSKD